MGIELWCHKGITNHKNLNLTQPLVLNHHWFKPTPHYSMTFVLLLAIVLRTVQITSMTIMESRGRCTLIRHSQIEINCIGLAIHLFKILGMNGSMQIGTNFKDLQISTSSHRFFLTQELLISMISSREELEHAISLPRCPQSQSSLT